MRVLALVQQLKDSDVDEYEDVKEVAKEAKPRVANDYRLWRHVGKEIVNVFPTDFVDPAHHYLLFTRDDVFGTRGSLLIDRGA